jgi:hypothetical protein
MNLRALLLAEPLKQREGLRQPNKVVCVKVVETVILEHEPHRTISLLNVREHSQKKVRKSEINKKSYPDNHDIH